MIVDNLCNLHQYETLCRGIHAADTFLRAFTLDIPNGKYPIDGENVYAVVQRYKTLPEEELLWECHDKYWDVQYVADGRESVSWTERKAVDAWGPYDDANDSRVADGDYSGISVSLSVGQFAIFAPQDAHKPRCICDRASDVVKVVVKVRCER